MTELLTVSPAVNRWHLLLAHGAGASMTSPFMETMTELVLARGIAVSRFEFSYMAARRGGGKRRPPPKAETLVPEYIDAVMTLSKTLEPACKLLIGGKSMGGRIASLVADGLHASELISGLVVLGYPFHPPGKPQSLRTTHLAELACPALFVQGERDPFGALTEVAGYGLSPAIQFSWAGDGDHDLGPRGGRGQTRSGNLAAAADAILAFASCLK